MITLLRKCQLSHKAFLDQLNSAVINFNLGIQKVQVLDADEVAALMEKLKEKAEEIEYLKGALDFYAYKIQELEAKDI